MHFGDNATTICGMQGHFRLLVTMFAVSVGLHG